MRLSFTKKSGLSSIRRFIGEHPLAIRHKPSGESKQGNYTTLISWGRLGKTIRDANLSGRTLNLYKEEGGEGFFKIDIV